MVKQTFDQIKEKLGPNLRQEAAFSSYVSGIFTFKLDDFFIDISCNAPIYSIMYVSDLLSRSELSYIAIRGKNFNIFWLP